jgi:hypothetical protein
MPGDSLVDVLLEFLEALVHQILFVRELYSPELFERQRLYGIAVRRSRHPELNSYISEAVAGLKVRLGTRKLLGRAAAAQLHQRKRRTRTGVASSPSALSLALARAKPKAAFYAALRRPACDTLNVVCRPRWPVAALQRWQSWCCSQSAHRWSALCLSRE